MNQKCITTVAMAAAVGVVFAAEWREGDLTVERGNPVTLTSSDKTNSSLTLHDDFTVKLSQQAKYKVGTETTAVSLIALGPDAGDDAVFALKSATLNQEGVGGSNTWRAEAVVGANGGNGIMKIGSSESWVQCPASLVTFTLAANAQPRTGETDFPALEIGYASQLNVSNIRNENAKPLRIRFVNPSTDTEEYPGSMRSYWKSNEGFLHVSDAGSSIILEGGKTGAYKSSIRLRHWGYDDNIVNTILTSTSQGRLKTTGDCDLYLDTSGISKFKIASLNYDWEHSGDTILLSNNGGSIFAKGLLKKSGSLLMGVAYGLPYGPQTGNLVLKTNPAATSYSTLDLMGYSQKLNGLVLEGPSVVQNSGAEAVTVTFGAKDASGRVTGTFAQDNIRYEKVGAGVLTLSNATFTTLCVTGGRVRIAPGSANAIGTLAVTNAVIELPADAAGATLTVGTWLLGENAARETYLPGGQPSNTVSGVTATLDPTSPLVKTSDSFLTCMTPANANGAGLDVRGGVLRMGGCTCDNKYWKMVFKKSSAPDGIYTYTVASIPGFKFELTLGLGNLGLFSADGRQTIGMLEDAPVGTEAGALQEGQCSSKNPYVIKWNNAFFQELYSTTITDPVFGGGAAGSPIFFLRHSDMSSAKYDDKTATLWGGDYGAALAFTNGTSKALNPEDPQTWEEVRWRQPATAVSATSYNLRRFVNNNESNRAHPTDWELWSSADGATWVKMDERSGQTFDGSSSGAMMSPQFAYTYNHHVPYLFNAQNASWRFDTFGTISVAAGAVLDLDSIPDANIAINALSVDLTAGAGTITKFVPAENGTIYLTHPRVSDYAPNGELNSKIVLPLTIGTVLSPEKLKSWQVVVDGTPITNGELAVRDGALVVLVHHGLLLIFR